MEFNATKNIPELKLEGFLKQRYKNTFMLGTKIGLV